MKKLSRLINFTIWFMILMVWPPTIFAQSSGQGSEQHHVVFDLDWTLINETTVEMASAYTKDIIVVEGKYYRITQEVVKKLIQIHREPNVSVSFFSGGHASRNENVVRELYRRVRDRVGHDQFQPYLILNREHLEEVSSDQGLKFSDRLKKNLAWYFDLKNTVIVEDVRNFVPKEQIPHLIWLGPTYNDRPNFFAAKLEQKKEEAYSAPSFSEWQRDQNKMEKVINRVIALLREAREKNLSLATLLNRDYFKICSNLF